MLRLAEPQFQGLWPSPTAGLLSQHRRATGRGTAQGQRRSNTVADHLDVLGAAITVLPSAYRRDRVKHHVITDGKGIPLAVTLTGGNRSDVTQLLPLIEAIPPVGGRRGGPGIGPSRCSPTASATTTYTVPWSKPRASARSSPAAASRTAPAWANTGTSWNRPSRRHVAGPPHPPRRRTPARDQPPSSAITTNRSGPV